MIISNPDEDFYRDVWCLLGLPFDAIGIDSAASQIRLSAALKKRCFISTPNLNFTITALDDAQFRDTIISSELSLLDGMPLLWVARLLGLGVTEKVSGSDLFDYLSGETKLQAEKLKVFFFGGEDTAAQHACENLNAGGRGLTCVGYLNPGFGPVDALSSPEITDTINAACPDFLVIALGAKKGLLWIERNRDNLVVPVVSHLGAVVNFTATRVSRAPRWMQRSGLEWLWRIYQEPALWRRYLVDGLKFLLLLMTRVAPYFIWKRLISPRVKQCQPPSCQLKAGSECTIIIIEGDCSHDNLGPVRDTFVTALKDSKRIELNLSGVDLIDGAFVGLCQLLLKHTRRSGGQLIISGASSRLRRIFRWNCAEYLMEA